MDSVFKGKQAYEPRHEGIRKEADCLPSGGKDVYRWKKQHHDERHLLESDSDESLYDKYGNQRVYSTRHHGRLRSPDRGDSRSPKVTDLPHSSLLWFDVIEVTRQRGFSVSEGDRPSPQFSSLV